MKNLNVDKKHKKKKIIISNLYNKKKSNRNFFFFFVFFWRFENSENFEMKISLKTNVVNILMFHLKKKNFSHDKFSKVYLKILWFMTIPPFIFWIKVRQNFRQLKKCKKKHFFRIPFSFDFLNKKVFFTFFLLYLKPKEHIIAPWKFPNCCYFLSMRNIFEISFFFFQNRKKSVFSNKLSHFKEIT